MKLTLSALAAVASLMPKTAVWRHCTLTPASFERLKHDPEFRCDRLPFLGMELRVKHGQVADCWAFSDSKTLRKYLEGELSELDLMGLIETGSCKPTI